MTKHILGLMSVMVLFGMVSCSDENIEGNGSVKGGELIQFSIDPAATRTVYEAETGGQAWQIDWLTGDKIRIFCDRAEGKTDAEYTITPTDATHSTPQAASKYGIVNANADGLRWNGALMNNNYPTHDFYAVYPSTAVRSTSAGYTRTGDVVDLKLVNNQVCTVTGTEPGDGDTYIAAPDMTNAYMTAAATGVDPRNVKSQKEPGKEGGVDLKFSPIMTTLDLFVTYDGSTNGSGDETLNVTGITVTLPGVPRVAGNCFRYKIAPNTNDTGSSGSLVTDGIPTSTETFFAGVRYNGGNSLPLQAGQSVKFTVFLPPVEISDANQITVRLNSSGSGDFTVKVGASSGAQNIKGSAKKQILLPPIFVDYSDVKPNNWISQLDDNIYVNQLSIPGTNNSAAFKSFGSVASSQGLDHTLTRQWNDGVRAFEFRTSVADYYFGTIHGGSEVECYDSGVNLNLSFDEAMTEITGLLAASPGEFAIVIVGFQSQQYSDGGWLTGALSYVNRQGKSVWQRREYSGLSTVWRTYNGMPYFTDKWKDWFVDFDPAMTIKDARKHIILINYDQYGQNESGFVMPGVFIPGAETANSASVDFGGKGWFDITYKGNADTVNKMFIQAMNGQTYGNTDGDKHGAKQAGIFEADAEAVKLHTVTDDSHNWVINYVGGSSATSTADYTADAAVNNKMFNEWMIGNTINGKTRAEGPTGIVLVSHQGVEKYGGTNVYGENLPQTIINNNFKFRMQRKEH